METSSFSFLKRVLMVRHVFWFFLFIFLVLFFWFLTKTSAHANETLNTTTASRITLVDAQTAQTGDIVSYTPDDNTYRLSKIFSDEHVFGVIVTSPILLMETGTEDASSSVPVVRAGEAVVQVSDAGGDIHAGDIITTSGRFLGTGERADRTKPVFILGFALKDAQFDVSETGSFGTTSVRFGTVPVALRIGQYVPGKEVAKEEKENIGSTTGMGLYGIDYFSMFRYALGAVIALAGVIVALRRFGDMFTQGVVSVGRNPLARSQIRSMMLWNSLLILLIGGLAFGVGMTIIFW